MDADMALIQFMLLCILLAVSKLARWIIGVGAVVLVSGLVIAFLAGAFH